MKFENFKKLMQYSFKTKNMKKIGSHLSNIKIDKVVIGTTMLVLPGGIIIGGVFVAFKDLKEKYEIYKENVKLNNNNIQNDMEKEKSFLKWLNENYKEYFKEKSKYAKISLGNSFSNYKNKITKISPKKQERHP